MTATAGHRRHDESVPEGDLPPRSTIRLTLGGIGGDSHSVGLILLRGILVRAGFQVQYLGIQNSIANFCVAARLADAVLVSNMDGHAAVYLSDLPALQQEYRVAGRAWYLGGHPAIHLDEDALASLRRLGFRRVFGGYVEPASVIAMLDEDLGVRAGGVGALIESTGPTPRPAVVEPPVTGLFGQRDEVLAQWHTGSAAVDLVANAITLSGSRPLSEAQQQAAVTSRCLIQPRTGTALVNGQRDLFRAMAAADADVLSFQIDSLTRNNLYEEAGLVLKRLAGSACGMPAGGLNGFPAVNHGVAALREFSAEFGDRPLQVRHSTHDPRLLAEITFAGGVAAFEGGAITYNLPYYPDYPPEQALVLWRYVDMLAGMYRQRFGIAIDREFFGVLTASLVPPCLAVAVNVLEAMLAAREGVVSLSLGYAEQGHRAQDVASVRALAAVATRYLRDAGCADVAVHTVFHQYMGAFPTDVARAMDVLRGSAVTAGLSGARRVMLKTYVEAVRIPSAEENAASLRLVRDSLASVTGDEVDWAEVAAEEELIIAESSAILDAALAAGGGLPGRAVVEAVRRGYLDIPFSPSRWNAGRALAIRDTTGAVRFAETGGIPLPPDVADRHRQLVDARVRQARGRSFEELAEDDVLALARGGVDRWPYGVRP